MTSALRPTGSTRAWRRLRAAVGATLPRPCTRCGVTIRPGDPWHLDHVVARVDGGTDDNVGPAHPVCNMRAGQTASRRLRPVPYRSDLW